MGAPAPFDVDNFDSETDSDPALQVVSVARAPGLTVLGAEIVDTAGNVPDGTAALPDHLLTATSAAEQIVTGNADDRTSLVTDLCSPARCVGEVKASDRAGTLR